MTTNEKIKELARQETFKYFFCNVDSKEWPKDPDAFIENVLDKDKDAFVYDLEFTDQEGRKYAMIIWRLYESFRLDSVVGLMKDFEEILVKFYEKASKIEKG